MGQCPICCFNILALYIFCYLAKNRGHTCQMLNGSEECGAQMWSTSNVVGCRCKCGQEVGSCQNQANSPLISTQYSMGGQHRHSNGEIDSFIRRLMMKVLEVRESWAGLALEICPHAVAAKQQQQSQPRPVHQHHILHCTSPTHLTLLSFNTLHIALCTLRCKQRLSHCTGNRSVRGAEGSVAFLLQGLCPPSPLSCAVAQNFSLRPSNCAACGMQHRSAVMQ